MFRKLFQICILKNYRLPLEFSLEFPLYFSACNKVHNSGLGPDLDQTAKMAQKLSLSPEFVGQGALCEYIVQFCKHSFEVETLGLIIW